MHSRGHKEIKETSHNPDAHRPPLSSLAVKLSAGRHELWVRVALVNAFYMKSIHWAKKNRNASRSRERNPVALIASGITKLQKVLDIVFDRGSKNLWASLSFLSLWL